MSVAWVTAEILAQKYDASGYGIKALHRVKAPLERLAEYRRSTGVFTIFGLDIAPHPVTVGVLGQPLVVALGQVVDIFGVERQPRRLLEQLPVGWLLLLEHLPPRAPDDRGVAVGDDAEP